MPELSDLLHRSVDDVDVPRPDVHGISARGRSLRTRRRLGTAVAAAVVLGAIGGGIVVADPLGGDPRSEIATPPKEKAPATYDAWSAWTVDGRVSTGGDPVEIPGMAFHLAQTSVGVVVTVYPEGEEARYNLLVRPDGSTRRLSTPSTFTVDGDISAPRVAWLETRQDALVLHVWDVEKDEQLARVDVPSPGTTPESDDEFIPTVLLDGDAAYFQTHDASARRVDWRTGEVEELTMVPSSVRAGVMVASDGTRWEVRDAATGEVRRTVEGDLTQVTVSPDGRWLFGTSADGTAFLEPVDGGDRVPLGDISTTASWSRDGAVVGQKGTEPVMLRCTTDGECTEKVVGEGDEVSVLSADFLNVG